MPNAGLIPDSIITDPEDTGAAPWDPDQVPALLLGYEIRARQEHVGSHVKKSLESFGNTMNAFASIIIPADPLVPGDLAAGELRPKKSTSKKGKLDGFFKQMIRFIQLPFTIQVGVDPNEHDALSVFNELDERSKSTFGKKSFSDLTTAQQQSLVNALLTLPGSPTPAESLLFFQATLMVIMVKFAYWTNYPENKFRGDAFGFGDGQVIHSDEPNQISNPNIRGTGTAYDYLKWAHPARKALEDLFNLAFLEAGSAASEAAFATLKVRDLNGTLIDIG